MIIRKIYFLIIFILIVLAITQSAIAAEFGDFSVGGFKVGSW